MTQFGFAQVGIGTTSPTLGYALDVDGSILIQKNLKIPSLPNVITEDADFKFLLRNQNSIPAGEVSRLDVKQINVAPVNIINYTLHNLSKDNVEDVNLQFDASKYVVGIANFRYVGQVIEKGEKGLLFWKTYPFIGYFVSRTFVNNNTWHLEIMNRNRDNADDNAITYHVTLIVFDRKYFKELPTITANLGGNNTGSANAPVGL